MSDEDIDTSDIPPLDETFFAHAQIRLSDHKAFNPKPTKSAGDTK